MSELEILFPILNHTEVANRSLSIVSNNNETIRPFIKYPKTITFFGLEQGQGSVNVTLPSSLNASAILGIRQLAVLNFSSIDQLHMINFHFQTENRTFTVIERFFLCQELQFIGMPDSNPFYDSIELSSLGLEMKVKGKIIDVNYKLGLSDSFRQLKHFSENLNIIISTFVISTSISLAALFIAVFSYMTMKKTGAESTVKDKKSRLIERMVLGAINFCHIIWRIILGSISKEPTIRNSRDNSLGEKFVSIDFEQQYAEFRHAEDSRLRYVEFYIALIGAVLTFYGVFIQWRGFPLVFNEAILFLAILFSFLFEVGRRLVGSLTSTRVAQLRTAIYIEKLRDHVSEKQNARILRFSKVAIGKNWWDEQAHAIRLILLVAFVNSLVFAVSVFEWSHIALGTLFSVLGSQFIGIPYDMIISLVIAAHSLPLCYFFLLKRGARNEIESAQKRSREEISALEKQKFQ